MTVNTFIMSQTNPDKRFSLLIILINVPFQYIRMISEGSCDTEDWRNDAENSALHQSNKLHLKYILK